MSYNDVSEEDRARIPAHIAAAMAANSNRENRELFSEEDIERAEDLYTRVSIAFPNRRVFLNYRKSMVTVKVEGVRLQDRVQLVVSKLDTWCKNNNVEIAVSRGGTSRLYRFKRSPQSNVIDKAA